MAFCKNCGNQLNEGAKFCPKCGTVIGGEAVSPASAPTPQEVKQPEKKAYVVEEERGFVDKILHNKTLWICAVIFLIGFTINTIVDSESASGQSAVEQIETEAFNSGYEFAFGNGGFDKDLKTESIKEWAKQIFVNNYGAPSSPEEKEIYNKFIDSWIKGYREGQKNR
jgi:hypothetical protein